MRIFFSSVVISENLFKSFLFLKTSFYLCLSVKNLSLFMFICENLFTKNILKTAVLKCTFWGSNFEVHLCSEMHFLREQFWSVPLFWNAFLREQFWSTTMFWNAFFKGAILKCIHVLKRIFRRSNYFLFHGCWLVWLLLYVFLSKLQPQAKLFQFWHV